MLFSAFVFYDDVLLILIEASEIQKYVINDWMFKVTTSSSAASNKIYIHYHMKVLNFPWFQRE